MCLSNQADDHSAMAPSMWEYLEAQLSWLNHRIAPRNAKGPPRQDGIRISSDLNSAGTAENLPQHCTT